MESISGILAHYLLSYDRLFHLIELGNYHKGSFLTLPFPPKRLQPMMHIFLFCTLHCDRIIYIHAQEN